MSDDRSFFRDLRPFRDFSLLADASEFVRAPDSWSVVITDVRGSTQAIRHGRYKDVNLVGAASITCVLNAVDDWEIPFVFGGDGATLLVPTSLVSAVARELQGLQALSIREFGLELRVGHVPLTELRRSEADLWVGKYELSPGNHTAQFKGGALSLAEEMIKKGHPPGAVVVQAGETESPPELTGLSCRLKPLDNRKGLILSLLIKPAGPAMEQDLKPLLAELKRILQGDFLSARPVSLDRLAWSWPPPSWRSEVALQKRRGSAFLQTIATGLRTLISAVVLSFDIPLGPFKPRVYKSELVMNSDFKKFDETLRMVIDCSPEQAAAIESLLEPLQAEGRLCYGLHRSSRALMTCLVKSASGHRHLHFIDGAEGGYALAAVQMKAQLELQKSPKNVTRSGV